MLAIPFDEQTTGITIKVDVVFEAALHKSHLLKILPTQLCLVEM